MGHFKRRRIWTFFTRLGNKLAREGFVDRPAMPIHKAYAVNP
jgi:hypothetical protein